MRYRTISINLFVPAHARENARTRRHSILYTLTRQAPKRMYNIKVERGAILKK